MSFEDPDGTTHWVLLQRVADGHGGHEEAVTCVRADTMQEARDFTSAKMGERIVKCRPEDCPWCGP